MRVFCKTYPSGGNIIGYPSLPIRNNCECLVRMALCKYPVRWIGKSKGFPFYSNVGARCGGIKVDYMEEGSLYLLSVVIKK